LLEHALPESTSEAADEGSAAHARAEWKLRKAFDGIKARLVPSKYDCPEMERCTDDYAQFIAEMLAEVKKSCAKPVVLVEQRIDFSHYVPDGFGTCDCVIVADNVMHVVDFKYGRGVTVEAADNPQMMLYALGVVRDFELTYDIRGVSMTIYQPRREHYSAAYKPVEELIGWAESVLKPAAKLAIKGKGEFASGEWCRFCKIGATCRARAEANQELARHEFAEPAELSRDEIADVLRQVDELVDWAGAVKRHALQSALNGGKWPGFKLVEGRSVRRITDAAAALEAAEKAKVAGAVTRLELKGITDMEKILGKEKFNAVFGGLVKKPQGAPTLVPESDKRPALNLSTAKETFAEIKEFEDAD
jgi:hypothetical protein